MRGNGDGAIEGASIEGRIKGKGRVRGKGDGEMEGEGNGRGVNGVSRGK